MTIYEKLLELFPDVEDGLILGKADAIVGQFGLQIKQYTVDGTFQTSYMEGEKIPIVQFFEKYFISSEIIGFRFDYNKFKGIEYKIYE